MKRNLDLIRNILLTVEKGDAITTELCTAAEYFYHVALLLDAGLVEGAVTRDSNCLPNGGRITRLTWSGHEFLDSARDEKIWKLAKEKFLTPAATWTFSVVSEWLRLEIRRRLGLEPPQVP